MGEKKRGFFSRLVEGLTKTRDSIVSGIDSVFSGFSAIDDDFYEEIEETLIMGDLLYFLNIGNKAADLHRRVNLHVPLYLIRRIQTIYRDTGSRRIQSHPRQFHDRRAVRTVAHRNMNACSFQTFMEFLVPLIL